jgi:hypothetical protein
MPPSPRNLVSSRGRAAFGTCGPVPPLGARETIEQLRVSVRGDMIAYGGR